MENKENINLNDPNNLNPVVRSQEYKPLPKETPIEMRGSKITKEEQINQWNEKPEIKNNKIKAIDTENYKEIKKGSLKLKNVLAFFGIVALLVIAAAVGTLAYIAYTDGTFLEEPLEIICGENTCGEQSCVNTCNKICGNITCGDCIFPEELVISYKNETD